MSLHIQHLLGSPRGASTRGQAHADHHPILFGRGGWEDGDFFDQRSQIVWLAAPFARQGLCHQQIVHAALQVFPGFRLDPDEDADPRFGAAFESARKGARR